MTSATAPKSRAQKLLEQREQGYYINLSHLSKGELASFLTKHLGKVDLSELRGFETLGSELSHSALKSVSSTVQFDFKPSADPYAGKEGFSMETHVIRLHRGVIDMTTTYVRLESGEETTDYHVASETWGRDQAYIKSTSERIFVLRRPRSRTSAYHNLIDVKYFREKVPHKDQYKIVWVKAVQVTPESFYRHFGKEAGERAKDLISEISSSYYRTRDALKSKLETAQEQYFKWNSLSETLTHDR